MFFKLAAYGIDRLRYHCFPSPAARRWKQVLQDTCDRTTNCFFAKLFYARGDCEHAKLLLKCLKKFKHTDFISYPWERVEIDGHILTVTPHPTFGDNAGDFVYLETFREGPNTAYVIFLYALGCLRDGHYDRKCIELLQYLKDNSAQVAVPPTVPEIDSAQVAVPETSATSKDDAPPEVATTAKSENNKDDVAPEVGSPAQVAWKRVLTDTSRKSNHSYFALNLYKLGDFDHAHLLLKCLSKFRDPQHIIDLPWWRVCCSGDFFGVMPDPWFESTQFVALHKFEETPDFARAIFLYALGCLRSCPSDRCDQKCAKILRALKSIGMPQDPKTPAIATLQESKTPDTAAPQDPKTPDTAAPQESKTPDTAAPQDPKTLDSPAPQESKTPDSPAPQEPTVVTWPTLSKAERRWNRVLRDVTTRSKNSHFAKKMYIHGDTAHAKLLLKCLLKFRDHHNLSLAWANVDIAVEMSGNTVLVRPDSTSFTHLTLCKFQETPQFAQAVFHYALGCLRNNCCDAECVQMLRTLKLLCS
jgi:hypothetical protein